MFPAAVPEILTGGAEEDVVAVNSQQSSGNVEDGVDVVEVKVGTTGSVAHYEVDQVHAEDYHLQTEQHDRPPLYLPRKYQMTRLQRLLLPGKG